MPRRAAGPASKDARLLKSRWERPSFLWTAAVRLRVGVDRARGVLITLRVMRSVTRSVTSTILATILVATAHAQVELPDGNQAYAITATAQAANRWQQGIYEVWLLRNCRITQGADLAQCDEAVLWIDHADVTTQRRTVVTAYLEGNVLVQSPRQGAPSRITGGTWFGHFSTFRSVDVQAGAVAGRPDVLPGVYQRGMEQRNPPASDALRQTRVEQVQFVVPRNELPPPGQPSPAAGPILPGAGPPPPGSRRFRVFPRGDVPVQFEWRTDPQTNQWIAVIEQGVNILIDGYPIRGLGGPPTTSTIEVSTDRLVLWTTGRQEPDLSGQAPQDARTPMELYMEGNVIFRQGDRTIYANRMYYDVPNELGTIMGADVLTPARNYQGLVRLHTEVLQQVGQGRFTAQNAYVTSSRLGIPRYRIEGGQISFQDDQRARVDPYTGQQLVDPVTGQPQFDHDTLLTARNDLVYIEDVPIFYWPVIATDMNESSFFLRHVAYKSDNVFGTQILTDFNGYHLLGIQRPAGTDFDLSLDYYSMRGFAEGASFLYHRNELLGVQGPVSGVADFWGISDVGTDNLGAYRGSVQPEPDVTYRYRFLWQHRQKLSEEWQITAEAGKMSDRNFLEEYFKQERETLKDQTTDVEAKWHRDNQSLDIFAGARLNDFETQTEWLPRLDHYLLGESLAGDTLSWFEHTSLAYAQFRTATLPDPKSGDLAVSHLPWEKQDTQGGRFITRNELDLPAQLGPVKVVPYALGELGYWGEGVDGQQLNRAYYQAGIRATLPMWSVDSTVDSALWNVHGLAHKIDFNAEYFHAQASQHLDQFPLYDPLDDDQIEDARRRYVLTTFNPGLIGTPLQALPPPLTRGPPRQFDERFYAFRTDMQGLVTAPSMEIADNLDEVRLGVNQRWQTKRGNPENPHIIDWIEFDTDITLYPNPDRDNFGTVPGLLDYNFIWHVGDRLTLLSDGIFDFFGEGQKIITMGGYLSRPPRGALYAGMQIFEGPISSRFLSMSYSYLMSPKWTSSFGFSIDLMNTKNVGQSFRITRIGESLLVSGIFNYDPVRNTYGVNFMIEPRFAPMRGQFSSGVRVPPAGALGLE